MIITIGLLSRDIHPCPSLRNGTLEKETTNRPAEECSTIVIQTLKSRAGVVARRARVSHAGVGVCREQCFLGGLSGCGVSLLANDSAGPSGGLCVLMGPGAHARLAGPQSCGTITTNLYESRIPMVADNVNRKLLNPGIAKNRKRNVFQTVNHSRTVWDPEAKPKGLLCGHLNIRSILSKSEQIEHLLLDSNLDFLCLSETWLNQNASSAALNIAGYNVYRRDREGSKKGGGVMAYMKNTFQCHKIQWSNCRQLECLGLNVTLSPQMSFDIVVKYRSPSADNSFYENFEKLLKEEKSFDSEIIIMGVLTLIGRTKL